MAGDDDDDDDEDKGAPLVRVCVDCRANAPVTHTNYTLISSRYGWRLSRRIDGDKLEIEWRCPRCWERHKRAKSVPTPVPGLPYDPKKK